MKVWASVMSWVFMDDTSYDDARELMQKFPPSRFFYLRLTLNRLFMR